MIVSSLVTDAREGRPIAQMIGRDDPNDDVYKFRVNAGGPGRFRQERCKSLDHFRVVAPRLTAWHNELEFVNFASDLTK